MMRGCFVGLIALSLILFGCEPSGQKQTKEQTGTITKPSVPATGVAGSRQYNDTASFIAGLAPESGSAFAEQTARPEWMKYSASFDKGWTKLETTHLATIRQWSNEELRTGSDTRAVFYPFSGPDVLHAITFFPKADRYVLVALEPAGTVPTFKGMTPEAMDTYFATVARSLDSLLNFGFFKTNDMKVEVKHDLEGSLPILMFFLARTGNRIDDVKPIQINPEGVIVAAGSSPQGTRVAKGIDILFECADARPRHLYYFSVNLHNDYLKKSPFRAYIAKLDNVSTYLKSASYLMHKDYFSIIRDAILDRSALLVQDDSGIPFRFFKPETWDVSLYGVYSGPIAMFKGDREQDLADAYKQPDRAKPLPFGIGYNWRLGQSNLLVAKKKS
jgi:hypothetical protein